MNIKKILILAIFAIAIVGIIAPASAAIESANKDKVYSIESKEKSAANKITWNANGGTIGSKKTITTNVKKGSKIGKLPTTPKRSGHTFSGWYTKKTGGSKITVNTKPTKAVSYFAQWEKQYTLSFDPAGGDVKIKSKKITYNKAYGALPTPTHFAYSFAGWYTSKSGGSKVSATTKMSAKDVKVYAQWKERELNEYEKKLVGGYFGVRNGYSIGSSEIVHSSYWTYNSPPNYKWQRPSTEMVNIKLNADRTYEAYRLGRAAPLVGGIYTCEKGKWAADKDHVYIGVDAISSHFDFATKVMDQKGARIGAKSDIGTYEGRFGFELYPYFFVKE